MSCEDVVSAEKKNNMQHEKTDKNTRSAEPSPRRFIEDLNDEEWHVSHLKDSLRRSKCEIDQYRRGLKNDGALVEYVSAYALQPSETDLLPSNMCPAPNISDIFKTSKEASKESNITSPTSNLTDADIGTTSEPINIATTLKEELEDAKPKGENNGTKGKRRRSDYQFSSIEYYDDEMIDFDAADCPDAVRVIDLDIDQLRNYDVECESMIEWRSLDS